MKTLTVKILLCLSIVATFFYIMSFFKKEKNNFNPEKDWAYMLNKDSNVSSDHPEVETEDPIETNTPKENSSEKNTETKKIIHSQEVLNYYNEIVMNSEYYGKNSNPTKWTKDMKIYIDGSNVNDLNSELKKIVIELNDIIDPINLKIVNNKDDANFFIFLGGYKDFESNYTVVYPNLLANNWGYFELYPYNYGIMYIDIFRCPDIEAQKHLLREELTQSLGLMNDSYKYPESIFYQGWTTTTEYTKIDKELIGMLYND